MDKVTEFATRYDCQIQYQYSFDGKTKQYYPIISFLHVRDQTLHLDDFQDYPLISFQDCHFQNITLKLDCIQDMNFRNCRITGLRMELNQFKGTLGFARSSVSLENISVTASPKILAIVNSMLIGVQEPILTGFDHLHTLAILDTGLDYLQLDRLLSQLTIEQLIITEHKGAIPLEFTIPRNLRSMRIKNTNFRRFFDFSETMKLELMVLEEVEFVQFDYSDLHTLENLHHLDELTINKSTIRKLPYLDLFALKKLTLGNEIKMDKKMIAKLRLQDVELFRV